MHSPVEWLRSVTAGATKADFGLFFLRALFLYFLLKAWRPVFNPNIRVAARRSRVPWSRGTVLVHAVVMIPVCVIAFGIKPLVGAGLTAAGAVVAMLCAGLGGGRQEKELIQLSFTPAPQERGHPDKLWIGACVIVAVFWMLSLYMVVRDIFSPSARPDEMILRWMGRLLLIILSAGAMALYSQRPKGMAATSDRN